MCSKKIKLLLISAALNISLAANACVEEGQSVVVYPGAPKCCKGLELQPPPPGTFGSAGKCVKKKSCIEEGGSVGVYPGALDCCKGLELQPPPPGVFGSAGKCVESRNPSSSNVDDSTIQSKDPSSGGAPSPEEEIQVNKH